MIRELKHKRAIEILEKLVENIEKHGVGDESERYMILALEVAISQLTIDAPLGEPAAKAPVKAPARFNASAYKIPVEEPLRRNAGAFKKNWLGRWVRIGGEN